MLKAYDGEADVSQQVLDIGLVSASVSHFISVLTDRYTSAVYSGVDLMG